jgi:23S rRNA (uracil1939-C5)-methyltransferase
MSLVDQGVDVLISGIRLETLDARLDLTQFAQRKELARLSVDEGLGAETLWEPDPATIRLSGVPVRFPPGAFLQATTDGEAALVDAVCEALDDCRHRADLFAGLGTFGLALGADYAAEASRDAAQALQEVAPRMKVEHRDLYRRPLDAAEFASFDGVVLDPPRAGAEAQVRNLARSSVQRVAYVSCNPATFARDAHMLVEGGFRLDWVRPVGQFRWSTHVELAAQFVHADLKNSR